MKPLFYIGIIVIVVLTVLCLWYFIFRKKRDSGRSSDQDILIPVKVPFQGSSLTAFAQFNKIKLKRLEKLNPGLFPGYAKLSDAEKSEIVKKLKGKELIVGFKRSKSEPISKEEFKPYSSVTNSFSDDPLQSELKSAYPKEEKPIFDDRDMVSRIRTLESVVEKIRQNNLKLDSVVSSFVEKENLAAEINNLKTRLDDSNRDKQKLLNKLDLFSGKVVIADFLDNYAGLVDALFSVIKSGYGKALELYSKIQTSDERCSSIVAQLLTKYYQNLPPNSGTWEEVVMEIARNKATSNPVIISTFRQIQTEEEKLREFKRILSKEVLEKYASSILILTGELTVLSRFTGNAYPVVREFEQFFDDFSGVLTSRIVNTGLEFKAVPLFKNYERFAGLTQQINQTCSLPYRQIRDIEKNSILEIISYGFGGEKTKIILA